MHDPTKASAESGSKLGQSARQTALRQTAVFRAVIPRAEPLADDTPLPETNFIDTLVSRKLRRLQIQPSGPASDQHAGGSPGENRAYHKFHRVQGGFLSVELKPEGDFGPRFNN